MPTILRPPPGAVEPPEAPPAPTDAAPPASPAPPAPTDSPPSSPIASGCIASDALNARQSDLEGDALAQGSRRFRQRVISAIEAGRATDVGAARRLLSEAIDPLAAAIRARVEDAKGKRGRPDRTLPWYEEVGYEETAYIAVKAILDVVALRPSVRRVASGIAKLLVDELKWRRFYEDAPALYRYQMGRVVGRSYAHQARSLRRSMSFAKVDASDLTPTAAERLALGLRLIDLVIEATGLVTVETIHQSRSAGRRPRTDVLLVPTEETSRWLRTRNACLEFSRPAGLPMVVPPLPWAPGEHGGYRFAQRGTSPLVRGVRAEHRDRIRKAHMPALYAALNRIQETPWRINPHVHALVHRIVEQGGGLAGLCATVDEPAPPRPDTGTIARDPDALARWHALDDAVAMRNHARLAPARNLFLTLGAADAVADAEVIYFPASLDFRGRIYPIPSYLHPQGNDLAKALLTFADGAPLGEHGAACLAVHGANTLGTSPLADATALGRATLQTRVDWIVAHTADIEAVAADPLGCRWWMEADAPLQFYAFCVEWAGYAKAARQGQGAAFVSSLPCAMDGTCNGLQHYAALLRDERVGRAVNLIPSDAPRDIYRDIADVIMRRLETAPPDEQAVAHAWLASGLVDRKLVKRPTMTFGYGSGRFGFSHQLYDFLKAHERWPELEALFAPLGKDHKTQTGAQIASKYMARLVWEALAVAVQPAFEGRAWMQTMARLITRGGNRVSWVVPGTGLPVEQGYVHPKSRRVSTMLAGRIFRPRLHEATDLPDHTKQANAIAPNIIHSLDAAALALTVQAASVEGVEHFGMVHDSYATRAADMPVLGQAARAAFVQLYRQTDVLGDLRAQLAAQVTPEHAANIPETPPAGPLDISQVLISPYFFS